MITREFTIEHEIGLHARPAATFVKTAGKFQADITLENVSRGSAAVNAKSIISVLTSGVEHGHTIRVNAEGEDAQAALDALGELIASNFGE
ncbi:MAG: HPr family phosphocarrier protein [Anaerolineales bacterium]|nr:HPr family phosphocarrier protein [Anaerolineales bacterium]